MRHSTIDLDPSTAVPNVPAAVPNANTKALMDANGGQFANQKRLFVVDTMGVM